MPESVFSKLLDDLTELQPTRVIPYLNNEPLTDPKLEVRIESLRQRLGNPEIEVSTNGALLTPVRARALMTSGTTDLFVSVFGYDQLSERQVMALDYERVRANVLQALSVRQDLGVKTRITVVQVDSSELDRKRLAEERSRWMNAGAEVELYGYLDRAGNVGTGTPQRDRRLQPCGCELHRHLERMYVLTDGTAVFCCHDWRVTEPMGNLMDSSLGEIWQSQHYKDLRQRVDGEMPSSENFICRSCKLCPSPE